MCCWQTFCWSCVCARVFFSMCPLVYQHRVVVFMPRFGWVKWNPETGKMDAHCARHKGCKADRRAKVGPLGMQALWLQSCCEDRSLRSSHVLAKSEVSGLDFFDARCRARAWVHTLAETDQKVADLLADEAASRDGPFFCLVDACPLCSQTKCM